MKAPQVTDPNQKYMLWVPVRKGKKAKATQPHRDKTRYTRKEKHRAKYTA